MMTHEEKTFASPSKNSARKDKNEKKIRLLQRFLRYTQTQKKYIKRVLEASNTETSSSVVFSWDASC